MNKFIGISLGLLLYGKVNRDNENKIRAELKEELKKNNSEDEINSRNFIKRQFEDFIPDYQLVNITAYFNNTTHYDQNIKSSNGFFFDYNDQVYLVSTAHSIIDNWQNVNANIANKIKFDINVIDSEIKQNDLEVTDYHYNRYFDVMVAKVSNVFRKYAWKELETNQVNKVKVVYLDPLSNNKIEKESEYVNQVNSSIHLGAIHHLLLEGSSGSPILYNDNKLVGMVTSTDEEYKNMSLSIPIKTIQSVIDNYKNNFKYFGFETNLINSNWLNSLSLANRKTLRENGSLGELVLNTENININPFDIITHVDNQLVGNGGARSINLALENQSNESFQIKGLKINPDFTKKYCTYPRNILKLKSQYIATILDVKINKVNKNQLVLDNVDQMLEFTNLKIVNKFTKRLDNYLIKSIDYLSNKVTLDRSGDFDTSSACRYFLNTNVYNTNINKDIDSNDSVISTTNYEMLEPFKIENELNENQYKSLIILALFKNWCFLIFDFIKDKDIALQHYIVLNEFNNLFYDILVDLFNNFSDFYNSFWGDFYIEFVSKANEFLGPNCVNIVKLFTAALVEYNNFNDELIYEFEDINEKTLPNNLGRYSNSLDDIVKSIVSQSKISKFNIDRRKLRKNLLFNDFSVSNFQSEFYDNKSKISDQSTFKKTSDYKLYAKNLELVYQEIRSVLAADLSGDKLYQIKYYTNIKSYWDHAGYLLSHILQDPLLDYQPIANTNDSIETRDLPKHLNTWQYNSVLQRGGGGRGSWITQYLHQESLLNNQDLQTFSNLTFYGLKNHPDFTQAYRSTFQATMDNFKQEASNNDWLNLQKWAHQILDQVKANQLEEAFQGFKNKVLQLTNQYNPDLQFDSIEALDSYFLAKQLAKAKNRSNQ